MQLWVDGSNKHLPLCICVCVYKCVYAYVCLRGHSSLLQFVHVVHVALHLHVSSCFVVRFI